MTPDAIIHHALGVKFDGAIEEPKPHAQPDVMYEYLRATAIHWCAQAAREHGRANFWRAVAWVCAGVVVLMGAWRLLEATV